MRHERRVAGIPFISSARRRKGTTAKAAPAEKRGIHQIEIDNHMPRNVISAASPRQACFSSPDLEAMLSRERLPARGPFPAESSSPAHRLSAAGKRLIILMGRREERPYNPGGGQKFAIKIER